MGIILLDEMLNTMITVVRHILINKEKISSNINITQGQIYAEFILESLVRKGVSRIEAYMNIQRVAFEAKANSKQFIQAIKEDSILSQYFSDIELNNLFAPEQHLASGTKIIDTVSSIVRNELSKSN